MKNVAEININENGKINLEKKVGGLNQLLKNMDSQENPTDEQLQQLKDLQVEIYNKIVEEDEKNEEETALVPDQETIGVVEEITELEDEEEGLTKEEEETLKNILDNIQRLRSELAEYKLKKEAQDGGQKSNSVEISDETKDTEPPEDIEIDPTVEAIAEEKEIQKDREEKPFIYYAMEKSNNSFILKHNTNELTSTLDLRWYDNSDENDPESFYCNCEDIEMIGENEGFFDYNILGFVEIIKNVKELEDDEGIDSESDKAIYKIIGPNDEIIADDIKGYDKADKIYRKKSKEYAKKLKEQFHKDIEAKKS